MGGADHAGFHEKFCAIIHFIDVAGYDVFPYLGDGVLVLLFGFAGVYLPFLAAILWCGDVSGLYAVPYLGWGMFCGSGNFYFFPGYLEQHLWPKKMK